MANHHVYYNQNFQNPDKKINRVYINPNFNRPDNIQSSSSSMYFNPNYLHGAPNLYNHSKQEPKDQASKAKIHVNPNFFRNPNVYNPIVAQNLEPCVTKPSISVPSSVNYLLSKDLKEELKKNMTAQSMHVTKSRYCLVRQKENVISTASIPRPVTTTVRVNKYKSVSLNAVKKNLATVKPTKSTVEVSSFSQNVKYKTSCKPIVTSMNNTRFKFVKSNTRTVLNQSDKKTTKCVSVRRSSLLNKILQKTTPRKINKLVLKKNNIPCPLFKKYGKCLRKIRGSCEYLHDKNHVSICRKFLKGICHDESCLLSHDLTDKKMPTCYFYLQGACTKDTCPYLHVKLNEKTKICQDFLRGYCEKGDKCLFRHINVCRELASKKACSLKPYSSKTNYVVKIKSRKKCLLMQDQEHRNAGKNVLDGPTTEQRYFKEFVEDESSGEKCDTMIKPSRIKLGTLPSFIQL